MSRKNNVKGGGGGRVCLGPLEAKRCCFQSRNRKRRWRHSKDTSCHYQRLDPQLITWEIFFRVTPL